jgi:glycosyltransferase involved in cell wall biosynthesis
MVDQKRIRILFVTSDASIASGVGRCIGDLVKNIDRQKFDPILVAAWSSAGEETIVEEVRQAGVQVVSRDLDVWYAPEYKWGFKHLYLFIKKLRTRIWPLVHLINENKIDVVYSNALPSPDASLAAWYCGLPHVWHLHEAVCGNQYMRPYLPCFATKWLIKKLSSRIIAVSNQKAAEFAGLPEPAGVRVVYNGVDLSRFKNNMFGLSSWTQSQQLCMGKKLVALVGIISAHKGHDTLIKAAARVIEQQPETAFILIGPELGSFGQQLREQIHALGIADKVFFLGPRNDVPNLLGLVNLLVLPSTQEALPLVMLEAMACGKPVVATRCGGPEEVVIDGETGFLVPVGDDSRLAERMKMILSDDALAARMGQAGRRRVEAFFSVSAYVRNIEKVIEEAYLTQYSQLRFIG